MIKNSWKIGIKQEGIDQKSKVIKKIFYDIHLMDNIWIYNMNIHEI